MITEILAKELLEQAPDVIEESETEEKAEEPVVEPDVVGVVEPEKTVLEILKQEDEEKSEEEKTEEV